MDLDTRMKQYENASSGFLLRRTPVIIRIDGKAFHSFTKGLIKPFDDILMGAMTEATIRLCGFIQGTIFGYTQSDEISLLLQDWATVDTDAWFDNRIHKMTSVAASAATLFFNNTFADYVVKMGDAMATGLLDKDDNELAKYAGRMYTAMFDARAFNLPPEEVVNYFIWRQNDATRNAVLSVGQANFGHTDLQGLKCNQIQEKLFTEKGINFNELPKDQRRGTGVVRKPVQVAPDVVRNQWLADRELPIFAQNRAYIEDILYDVNTKWSDISDQISTEEVRDEE